MYCKPIIKNKAVCCIFANYYQSFLRVVFFSEYFVNSNMDGKKGYTYPNPMILDQVRDNNVTLPL